MQRNGGTQPPHLIIVSYRGLNKVKLRDCSQLVPTWENELMGLVLLHRRTGFIRWMNGLSRFGICICNGGYKTEVPKKLFLTLPEKEVIQPHLPVRLPCYDFTPVTSPALGISLLAVKPTTSGMASSHSVTGGVYKARERIHRRMADRRLLAIPASCRRVAACNPN